MPPWLHAECGYFLNSDFGRFQAGTPPPYVRLCSACLSPDPKARPTFTGKSCRGHHHLGI